MEPQTRTVSNYTYFHKVKGSPGSVIEEGKMNVGHN